MKNKRQEALLDLIREEIVTTQEDLQARLTELGFKVTQSTVSRDIKELRIIKSQDKNGIYRYLVAEGARSSPNSAHFAEMFSRAATNVLYSMNTVIIKCYPGMASSACVALDVLFNDMVLGSLAGDDTVFAVTKSEAASEELTARLKKLI